MVQFFLPNITHQLTTELHLILFPYFLFPFLSIAMTASVFMTVGIALERYIAVHYPINYSQAINRYDNTFTEIG